MLNVKTCILLSVLCFLCIALLATALVLPVLGANAAEQPLTFSQFVGGSDVLRTTDLYDPFFSSLLFGTAGYQHHGPYVIGVGLNPDNNLYGIYIKGLLVFSDMTVPSSFTDLKSFYFYKDPSAYPLGGTRSFYFPLYRVVGLPSSSAADSLAFSGLRCTITSGPNYNELDKLIRDNNAYCLLGMSVSNYPSSGSLNVTYYLASVYGPSDPYGDVEPIPVTYTLSFVGSSSSSPGIQSSLDFIDPDWTSYLAYQLPTYSAYVASYKTYLTTFGGSTAYSQGFTDGQSYGYDLGKNAGITEANSTVSESSASYTAGKSAGITEADNRLNKTSVSYTTGYSNGIASAGNYTFGSLFGAVFDSPVNAFMQFFNFEIFGVNLTGFLSALFVVAIVVTVLRLCLGR